MKKAGLHIALMAFLLIAVQLSAQQLNGQNFTFPKGKTEWSDTVYKRLLTPEMAKQGTKPVLLGIRYKYIKDEADGRWYQIEITNKSADTKVKFKVTTAKGRDESTVKLDAMQTKVIEKFYAKNKPAVPQADTGTDDEYLSYPLEDLLENRW
jgi:hypothetical protein